MPFVSLLRSALARRLAYVLVAAALAWFGMGRAHAQEDGCTALPGYYLCQTRAQAYQQAKNVPVSTCTFPASNCLSLVEPLHFTIPPPDTYAGRYVPRWLVDFGNDGKLERNASQSVYYLANCPAGTEWFDSLQKCDKPCSARNADLGTGVVKWASSGDSQCIAECKYQIASDYQTRAITATVGGSTVSAGTLHGGIWEYTGDRCPAGTPPKPKEDEKPKTECTPAANGQTYCIMSNGNSCATSSAGRMICWRPNETGSKTDGPNTQTNTNGNESPNPPQGSEHTSTQHITTTTTTNTTYTTINNYTTTSGAPAGSTNQGVPTDGNGKPTTGSGSDDGDDDGEDDTSASGGGDCESPPITSGDPIMGMVVTQTWATRCAVEAGNVAKVTGDVGDCKSPFSVEGTNANAVKLRAMRAQICGPDSVANAGDSFDVQSTDAANAADGDEPTDEEPEDPFVDSKIERDGNWLLDKLDATGFLGGGSCPADRTIAVGAGSIQLSLGPICTMLSAISGLVLALAYLIAFRIMAS